MTKSNSINEIKKELQLISPKELIELCLALLKYKKDNKEFVAYLLFKAHNTDEFVAEIKKEIDELFLMVISQSNLYLAKKTLRKILRLITKYGKYINNKAISAELLIYFCKKLKFSGLHFQKSQLLINMYNQQLKKINSCIASLHEDLKQDYSNDLEEITII